MTATFASLFDSTLLTKAATFSLIDTVICMAFALALGGFIALVYKKTFAGVMYSMTYGVTLVAMTMISTLILMLVTSNVVLTLGMVGALSIIRFRTAIKEPMDVAFMFWAVAVGIVIGAGMIGMAIVGSLLIGVAMLVLCNRKQTVTPYILVLRLADSAAEKAVMQVVAPAVKKSQIKAKTVTVNGIELTLDVRLKGDDTDFVTQVSGLQGVQCATLVTYNGEYMS